MGSVGGAECVADIIVSQVSQFFGELFAVLGLFFAAEAGVLKEDHIAVLHLGNCLGRSFAGDVVIGNKDDFLAELLGQALCDRCQGFALVRPVLDFAEVRAEDDFRAALDELADGRKRSDDTGLVGDLAVLQRDVEIAADQDALALNVLKVFNTLFVQHRFSPS